MYITRFTRVNGGTEDYFYHTREEAEDHLKLFESDDSGLYRNIAVINGDNTVLTILPFNTGRPEATLRIGDAVKIRKAWCGPGEEKFVFAIRNMNELSENIVIACLNSNLSVAPTENVKLNMIELVV